MIARVYADGACIGNPGPGGFAAVVLVDGSEPRWLTGADPQTTNNQMELTAAIRGLEEARALGPDEILVYSDSKYLIRGITEWIGAWRRNGWLTSGKQPVKNRDLWMRLDALTADGKVAWRYVRGHAGNKYNEQCDRRAKEMAWQVARRRVPERRTPER